MALLYAATSLRAGRHSKFLAKLEIKMIVSMIVIGYKYEVVDLKGRISETRPKGELCFIKFKRQVSHCSSLIPIPHLRIDHLQNTQISFLHMRCMVMGKAKGKIELMEGLSSVKGMGDGSRIEDVTIVDVVMEGRYLTGECQEMKMKAHGFEEMDCRGWSREFRERMEVDVREMFG
ncbi:hypothetical protein L208DRAFT_1512696 [Tricholoma matsutake]|nr:hypothetical protein L208DRAFT_1512696 [Tricholoma matsutake 945]